METMVGNRTAPRFAAALCPIALFIAISIDASAQKPGVVSDMARFDRALIPALFAAEDSGYGDKGSQIATNLVKAWEVFGKAQEVPGEADAQWPGDMARIDDWIDRARGLEDGPSNREEVHALLLQIRDALRTFRERNGIRYFPDAVVDFKERFDALALLLKDGDFEVGHEEIADLEKAWGEVKGFRVDKIAYGLDYYRMGEFGAYRETVTASLEALRDAIDRKDLVLATTELETIQTNTTALYKLFGNFED